MSRFIETGIVVIDKTTEKQSIIPCGINSDHIILFHPDKTDTIVETTKGSFRINETYAKFQNLIKNAG